LVSKNTGKKQAFFSEAMGAYTCRMLAVDPAKRERPGRSLCRRHFRLKAGAEPGHGWSVAGHYGETG